MKYSVIVEDRSIDDWYKTWDSDPADAMKNDCKELVEAVMKLDKRESSNDLGPIIALLYKMAEMQLDIFSYLHHFNIDPELFSMIIHDAILHDR